jgi:hypothetical protein
VKNLRKVWVSISSALASLACLRVISWGSTAISSQAPDEDYPLTPWIPRVIISTPIVKSVNSPLPFIPIVFNRFKCRLRPSAMREGPCGVRNTVLPPPLLERGVWIKMTIIIITESPISFINSNNLTLTNHHHSHYTLNHINPINLMIHKLIFLQSYQNTEEERGEE